MSPTGTSPLAEFKTVMKSRHWGNSAAPRYRAVLRDGTHVGFCVTHQAPEVRKHLAILFAHLPAGNPSREAPTVEQSYDCDDLPPKAPRVCHACNRVMKRSRRCVLCNKDFCGHCASDTKGVCSTCAHDHASCFAGHDHCDSCRWDLKEGNAASVLPSPSNVCCDECKEHRDTHEKSVAITTCPDCGREVCYHWRNQHTRQCPDCQRKAG